jgi:hypothetical protein
MPGSRHECAGRNMIAADLGGKNLFYDDEILLPPATGAFRA